MRVELIGGPADGTKFELADDLQAFHVPCTVVTDNPAFQSKEIGPGFPCVATYALFQTLANGTRIFRLSGIHSKA
ncbi:hypothetical protein SEA_COLUCCI_42 [Arthrobacter phage Colucci]|uniref:Uncharacterized protein n=1 Tax=Arthrobacter phage Colucci TaxID=2015834 RepID=A0A286N2V6_9CAUD|nr:hypothetical protein FDI27_gp042 [Arthrobacter phage Colucci]ASX98713.1 hypothetical protein SEA_COLUCCI_42 [Arthrobacter phage Colucci]